MVHIFSTNQACIISLDFCCMISRFLSNLRSHQGKKEVPVACLVSKPLVSCLWGCGESVNTPKLNIQEVQRASSSRPKGDPGLLSMFFLL